MRFESFSAGLAAIVLAGCASDPLYVVDVDTGARIALEQRSQPRVQFGSYESPQCGALELSSPKKATVVGRCRSQRDGLDIVMLLRGTTTGNSVTFTFEERVLQTQHVERGHGVLYYDPPRYPGDRARLFGRRQYVQTRSRHKEPTLRELDEGMMFTATAREVHASTEEPPP